MKRAAKVRSKRAAMSLAEGGECISLASKERYVIVFEVVE
jgi:hypothetical protein